MAKYIFIIVFELIFRAINNSLSFFSGELIKS